MNESDIAAANLLERSREHEWVLQSANWLNESDKWEYRIHSCCHCGIEVDECKQTFPEGNCEDNIPCDLSDPADLMCTVIALGEKCGVYMNNYDHSGLVGWRFNGEMSLHRTFEQAVRCAVLEN